jgi:hypothetical protein
MSENTTNKNIGNDEIDLLDLFKRMGRTLSGWINALGRAFLITIVFLLKRWFPLGLSIALGVGASYLLKFSSNSSFSSDLVLRNNVVSNSDMISYINRLHSYFIDDNTLALSDALSLAPKQLNNIIDIGAYWIIDKGSDGIPDYVDYENKAKIADTVNIKMLDRMDIRVKITAPQELGLVRTSIEKFIEKDSLFQQQNRVRLRQNGEMLTRLDYDIVQLDSLQKFKFFQETKNLLPKNGQQMIFLQEQKTQLIYPEIQNLYARKQALEADRELYKNIVTVLSDFSLPSRRENGGFFYAKMIVPILFFITLLILILLANKKKLEDVYRKY